MRLRLIPGTWVPIKWAHLLRGKMSDVIEWAFGLLLIGTIAAMMVALFRLFV